MKKCLLVLLLGLCFTGCSILKSSYSDIPLTSGNIPYALPAGTYMDIHGVKHIEQNTRWSISEADLFNDAQNINKSDKSKYINMITIVGIAFLIFRKNK